MIGHSGGYWQQALKWCNDDDDESAVVHLRMLQIRVHYHTDP